MRHIKHMVLMGVPFSFDGRRVVVSDDAWWTSMTKEQQDAYLKEHPGSKKAKDAQQNPTTPSRTEEEQVNLGRQLSALTKGRDNQKSVVSGILTDRKNGNNFPFPAMDKLQDIKGVGDTLFELFRDEPTGTNAGIRDSSKGLPNSAREAISYVLWLSDNQDMKQLSIDMYRDLVSDSQDQKNNLIASGKDLGGARWNLENAGVVSRIPKDEGNPYEGNYRVVDSEALLNNLNNSGYQEKSSDKDGNRFFTNSKGDQIMVYGKNYPEPMVSLTDAKGRKV